MAVTLHPSNPFYDHWCRSRNIVPETLIPRMTDISSIPSTRSTTEYTPRSPPAQSQLEPASQTKPTPSYVQPTFRTRSIGGPFSAGVVFEREVDDSPPNDAEIIIATVRVTDSFRRASLETGSELPSRPRPRSFLRRWSTRLSSPQDQNTYTALKMPRRDYKKWFVRDREGNYAGSEPEREWTRDDLDEEFGKYQSMPIRSIPGGSECGADDSGSASRSGSGSGSDEGSTSGQSYNAWMLRNNYVEKR